MGHPNGSNMEGEWGGYGWEKEPFIHTPQSSHPHLNPNRTVIMAFDDERMMRGVMGKIVWGIPEIEFLWK